MMDKILENTFGLKMLCKKWHKQFFFLCDICLSCISFCHPLHLGDFTLKPLQLFPFNLVNVATFTSISILPADLHLLLPEMLNASSAILLLAHVRVLSLRLSFYHVPHAKACVLTPGAVAR